MTHPLTLKWHLWLRSLLVCNAEAKVVSGFFLSVIPTVLGDVSVITDPIKEEAVDRLKRGECEGLLDASSEL